jgi:lambda family phage portal protein
MNMRATPAAAASPVRFRIKGTQLYVQPTAMANGFDGFEPWRAPGAAHEAAAYTPRLARWRAPNLGPNSVHGDLSTLRARSRQSRRDNGMADNIVGGLVADIVGTGIRPQFRTKNDALNQALNEGWAAWTLEADADGVLDFYGQQAVAVGSMIEGGECFARLRTRKASDGLTVPLQLQLLESEYCPEWMTQSAANGNSIVQGIELDLIGNRAAYWLYTQHPGDIYLGNAAGNVPVRVNGDDVVHLYEVKRPGAMRGTPWLTRALVKLRDLDKYDDAQVVRQQIAAMFAGFVQDASGDADTDGVLGVKAFAGMGNPTSDGISLETLEPGTMQVLPPGTTVEWSEPPSPGNNYVDFVKTQQRAIAASVGVLYEMATGDYGAVNDRTWRAAVSQFRRRCEAWQRHQAVFQFCRPVLSRWLDLGIAAGSIELPAGMTPQAVKLATHWLPVPWAYINPVQDMQAEQYEMRNGMKSRSQAVSERGADATQVDAEIAADNQRADKLGLVFDSDPRKTAKTGVASAQPEDPNTRVTETET